MKRWLWIWGPAVAQMAVIFGASSLPDVRGLPGGVSDHTAHFVGYAILGGLVVRALARARWADVTGRSTLRAWMVSAGYGITDEVHQLFIRGRSGTVDDWIADAVGAAVAVVVIYGVKAALVKRSATV